MKTKFVEAMTTFEILVVLIIISILVGLAAFSTRNVLRNSRNTQRDSEAANLRIAIVDLERGGTKRVNGLSGTGPITLGTGVDSSSGTTVLTGPTYELQNMASSDTLTACTDAALPTSVDSSQFLYFYDNTNRRLCYALEGSNGPILQILDLGI